MNPSKKFLKFVEWELHIRPVDEVEYPKLVTMASPFTPKSCSRVPLMICAH